MHSPLAIALVLIAASPAAATAPNTSPGLASASPVSVLAMQSARRPHRAAPRVRRPVRPVRPVRPRARPQPPRINTARIRNAIANGATPARIRKKIQEHHGQ